MTLLEFIADMIETNAAELGNFAKDLSCVDDASRLSMSDMEGEVRALKNGVSDMERELKLFDQHLERLQKKLDGGDSSPALLDELKDVQTSRAGLVQAMAGVVPLVEDVQRRFNDAKIGFVETVEYFGEDSATQP